MVLATFLVAALASSASAAKLYSTSYAGEVATLDFDGKAIKALSKSKDCGANPAWLSFDNDKGKSIYCLDEAWTPPNSTAVTYSVGGDGALKKSGDKTLITSAVHSALFGKTVKAIAIAHFGGSAFSTFTRDAGKLTALQNQTFTIPKPGPDPMQEKSKIHAAVPDPLGRFIVFPDYGADLIRVWAIDEATSKLTEKTSIPAPAGSGPRHAVFWSPSGPNPKAENPLFLFVVHELKNIITSYAVMTNAKGENLQFNKIGEYSTFGEKATPLGAKAAEILVSPDNKFIVASNRNATQFQLENPDKANSTKIPSDSLITYKPTASGKLEFVELAASGGMFPRHFSFNKDGSFVAVANQLSEAVAVYNRCKDTGKLKERVATAEKLGLVNAVYWDEQ